MTSWIKSSQKLSEGIGLINSIDLTKFSLLLERIAENKSGDLFSEDELKKLEILLNLNNIKLDLLLQSLQYIYRESCKFVIKPTVLQEQLQQLNIEEKRAEFFVKLWTNNTKDILSNLHNEKTGLPKQLEDVKWELDLQISSEARQKQKIPKTIIQLAISEDNAVRNDIVSIEMYNEQLFSFYDQLEDIQASLDNLKR